RPPHENLAPSRRPARPPDPLRRARTRRYTRTYLTDVPPQDASPKFFVFRRPRRTAMAAFVPVCRTDEVAEGRARAVEVDGLRLAVFNDGGTYHALLGRCPHENGPMGSGWIEDGEAVCPLHRWRFRLSSGRCTTVRGQSLHRFACEV